ncbi:MAG: cobalamin-dependent protein, partial [Planctomycetes bacterium]|nr:cobalamin-dependent protein [Planctomycetota bacterium]
MLSLGINIGHDRGAALVRDGEIVCAISLERLDRNKHSTGVVLPFQAMEYCLVQGRCKYKDLDVIVYNYPHHYNAYPVKDKIRAELFGLCSNVVFVSHHLAHAYGTFYASDFDEASVLVCDGAGNKYTGYAKQFFDNWIWPTKATEEDIEAETCYFFGNDKKELIYKRWQNWSDKRDSLDHKLSLGRMYRETCHHVGMGHLDGGKLMGLAPYGEKLIKPFNIVKRNGDDFDINLRHIKALPSGSFEDNAKAAWIAQYSLEETLVWLANMLYKKKPCRNICIAGGIGLNSVSNERILRESPFENIFIIPACNDSGMALGCAYFGYYHVLGQKQRKPYKAYTGRSYSQQEVIDGAKTTGYEYRQSTDLSGDVAKLIADGKIVGWFQGGSEYGPRALGNRSILCDPRKAVMKDILNHKVKHRENYRPFAPVVLWEEADKFFDIVSECPYMLQIVNVKEDRKNDIAAINHVDGTARVQTVRREQNEKLYDLIEVFGKITNVPVLLNTSFNVAGEPVVETPQDAVKCFLGTQIDVLIVNNFIIEKPVISEKKTDSTVLIEKLKQLCNGKPLKLHLGCGQKYFDDYVNIDYPPENHNVMNVKADLYYDIKKIALPENSVDEIRLHHVFEHFSRVEALALLIKWHKWLKKGGRLHIEVPDLIGSAKTLLSDVSMKVKMGVVRHLSGDQASSWGYHVDQWFGERFEETLYELGFSSIRIQHSQWSREPYLSNVVVTAVKDRNISVSQQLDSADRLLLASTVSPAEEKTYMVWKDQLQKALLNMSIQTETLPSKVKALVFSKDRAMQLMATIESFMSQCKDSVNVDMTVLYKASNSLHYQQYDELKRMFPDVDFVEENNFRNQVLSIINDSTYLLFLVDDSIFVQPFEINKAIAVLKDHEDAIGFSLRLGKNVTYCYPLDRDEIQPQFENISENIFKFNWYNSKCSFGCSLEVSSSVYRTDFILDMFNQFGFSNPNTLESKMSQLKMNYSWLPYLLMFDKSVAFSSPVNKTQKIYNNRSGDNHGYSVEKLAELFDGKKAIDVDRYAGFIPTSVQQETELYLKNRTDVEVDKAKSIVTNNDNDEKYTPESISAVEKPSILKKNKEANGKKRVLLTTSAAPQQSPFSTAEKRMPIGVGYLISVLRDASHEVFFIDNYLEPSNFLETGFLVENQIDFIGIYVNTICFRDTLRMLKKIDAIRKNGCWDGKIIVGGPHTTVAPETIPDFVDFVVQGEGEKAIIDIVEGRVSERVIRYPQIIYLDELPRPAWDVFAKMPYKWDMEWFEESPVFNMNTSRSCPFNCTFCSVRSIWGEKYTYFSAERVVDDVEYVVENFGAKGIYFREDNFTLNRKRLEEFCDLVLERNI